MSAAQAQARDEAPARPRFSAAPCAPEAFGAPIDVLAAEHARQLALCDAMDRIVHNPRHGADAAEIAAIRDYLRHDFPLHVADEEDDLFPLLRRRWSAGDDPDEVYELLRREHEEDKRLGEDVRADLGVLIAGRAFGDPARSLMNLSAFSRIRRRHLAWENAVLLPRASAHLTAADCAELGRRMAARRGIDVPG